MKRHRREPYHSLETLASALETRLGGKALWVVNSDSSIDLEWRAPSEDWEEQLFGKRRKDSIQWTLRDWISKHGVPSGSISISLRYNGVADSEATYRWYKGAVDVGTHFWSIESYVLALETARDVTKHVIENQEAEPFEIVVRFYWSPKGIRRERYGTLKKVRPL